MQEHHTHRHSSAAEPAVSRRAMLAGLGVTGLAAAASRASPAEALKSTVAGNVADVYKYHTARKKQPG